VSFTAGAGVNAGLRQASDRLLLTRAPPCLLRTPLALASAAAAADAVCALPRLLAPRCSPFVMNSVREIAQAFDDFRAGRLQDPADDVWAAA
jgi:hypothetical protein